MTFAFLALLQSSPTIEFDVESGSGLKVSVGGIPVIQGSWFQAYAPGWTKGFYSSRWQQQQIKRVDKDTIKLNFDSPEKKFSGSATYKLDGNKLAVTWDFNWASDESAKIEMSTGMAWLPPFREGQAILDGKTRDLPQIPPVGDVSKRQLGSAATVTELKGAAVSFRLKADRPVVTFDARGYAQDWAETKPLYWQGYQGIDLPKGQTVRVQYEYNFDAKVRTLAPSRTFKLNPVSIANGLQPDLAKPVLIPKPKSADLDWQNPIIVSNAWHFPAGRFKFFDKLKELLAQRFVLPSVGTGGSIRVAVDGGMADLKKLPGSYRLTITPNSASFIGQGEEGLMNAIYRFVQLCHVENGQIVAPSGVIEDEPRSDFRGVHLFVGPNAPEFQSKLWNNVLRPLGMNKVVLQCERTEWKTLPGVTSDITMKQEALVKLFDFYRGIGVEPIPLIQSFGHMEWFFARGANLDLAYNSQVPYAIDPRKPEAMELVGKLWDEAARVLKPQTVHFGLDEVDMRGFENKDPKHITELWELMLPFLGTVAKRNNTKMMLWGDQGLAPNEAVDAAMGDDRENASRRRAAIPRGSYIADWHYKAEQDHKPFLKSLQTWKLDGFKPIASSWYRPENIRGLYVAADIESAGTLQTTWAGYESNERNMLKALQQFNAMVYAADYSWSGRIEQIEELPYKADDVFARMYNPRQSPLRPERLVTLGRGDIFTVGGVSFARLLDAELAGVSNSNFNAAKSIEFALIGQAREIALALTCDATTSFSEPLGVVTLFYKDGTKEVTSLQYGIHVRSGDDSLGTFAGLRKEGVTCLRMPLQKKELEKITIAESNLSAGLRVDGISLLTAVKS